jgi:hypothetical protein
MHSDVRSRLQDAVQDAHKGTGVWASYIDHNGDGQSGDVVYSADGDIRKAPYEIQQQGGKQVANVDTSNTTNVVPRTTYEEEADDDDNYASMMEAWTKANIYTDGPIPLCERFISKDERDNAGGESFAGKGKSFPILKARDVMAAVRSMGQAGSDNYGPAQLKANIIRIAKAKGFESELPKAWRSGSSSAAASSSESQRESGSGQRVQSASGQSIKLNESCAFPADITIREAFGPAKAIKLIAPGKGSSAFYPAEVLKRDGPKVFKAGTPMRIDHPTRADEAARPEGSVKDWGAVLAEDAHWSDTHKDGPGLYAKIKPFSDHAQTIEEKGPYAGVSIRANGTAVMENGKPVMRDGVPVLAEFTSAEGVDMVTRAGAGGMFLSESARAANPQEVEMTESQIAQLVATEVAKATSALHKRALNGDAIVAANRVLNPLAFSEAAKQMIVENVLRGELPMKEGALDETKFNELVTIEAKRVGAVLSQVIPFQVRGMGVAEPVALDPKIVEAQRLADAQEDAEAIAIFESLGMTKSAAANAAKGRAA